MMNLFLATIILITDSILLPMIALVLVLQQLRALHNRWIFIIIITTLLLVADWDASTDDSNDGDDVSNDSWTCRFAFGLVVAVPLLECTM